MNRTVAGVLALALCLAVGHALQCYDCKIGLGTLCITTKTTCNAGELCFNGKATAAGVFKVSQKGCLVTADCNKTTSVTLPGTSDTTVYQMTKTCCNTDLCNSATPLTNTLILTFGSVASLLLAKLLI